uniref:Uncharacterized protein n=1 Tax=Panagrolaimus sp. PS1159 TaxID=55785 RepID=A0AC35FZS0_9BILA
MAYDGDEGRGDGEGEEEENNRIKPKGIEWIRKKVENSGPPNGRCIGKLFKPVAFLSRINWIIFLIFLFGIVGFYIFWINRVPTIRSAKESRNFSEDRVRNFLEQLVKDNEIDITLFLDKLSLINSITERHYVNNFDLLIHNTESCIGTNEDCFRRSGNIAALIGSKTQEPQNVIMLGCDFGIKGEDLIDYSPIPCGMLMDAMQTIIISNLSFVNDIIFSYNIKGKKYTDDPYLYLLKTYRVNAFIKLSGSAGREILLSNDKTDMLIEYLNNVLDKPSNMLIPKFLENYLSKKLIQNETEIEYENLMELNIYYPKIYDSIMDFIQYKKSGSVQRVGENLLSFVYALSGISYFKLKHGKFLGFNYTISDEYYGFPFLRSHIYAWGYYLIIVTIPLLLNTIFFRRIIFGIGISLSSPKVTMFFQLICLLPAIIFTADIIDIYFRAVMKENFEGFKILSAIFGILSAFLISNLTFVSRNIIFDWGTSEYIPANDCPWLNLPEISEHRERYWKYS